MPGNGASPRPWILIGLLCSLWLVSFDASQTPPLRGPLPQTPPSGDFDLVLSYVTVTAAKNAAAPRLATENFHVFEDNKEQGREMAQAQREGGLS